MITSWDIYWITRLDYFCGFFVGFFLFLLGLFIIFGVVGLVALGDRPDEDERKNGIKYLKGAVVAFVLMMFFLAGIIFTPSTKEVIAIYAIPKMANNEDVQQIPANFAKLINGKLQEWMKDVEIIPKESK